MLPTNLAAHELRRYVSGDAGKCAGRSGYHSAVVELPDVIACESYDKDGDVYDGHGSDDFPHDDPRWPRACDCGYEFGPADQWQHNSHRLWRRASDPDLTPAALLLFNHHQQRKGEMWSKPHACGARTAPPGALRDCLWYRTVKQWQGDDGHSVEVVLPDGCLWLIDGPANNGPGWDRTGTWPRFTARPSILTPGYHGYLTDGVLVPC